MSFRPRRRTARTSNFARKVASIAKRAVDREHANWYQIFNQECGDPAFTIDGVNEVPCTTYPLVLYGQGESIDRTKFLRAHGGIWFRDHEQSIALMAPMRVRVASYKWPRPKIATTAPDYDLFDNSDYSEGPWIHIEEKLLWPRQWAENQVRKHVGFEFAGGDHNGLQACAEADLVGAVIASNWHIYSDCQGITFTEEARPLFFSAQRFIPRGLTIKEDQTLVWQFQAKYITPGVGAGPSFDLFGGIQVKMVR